MSYRFGFQVDLMRNPPSGSGPLRFRDETIALAVRYMLAPRAVGCGPLSLHQADGHAVVLMGGAPTVVMRLEAWQALVDKFYPADKDGFSYIEIAAPGPEARAA